MTFQKQQYLAHLPSRVPHSYIFVIHGVPTPFSFYLDGSLTMFHFYLVIFLLSSLLKIWFLILLGVALVD